MNKIKNFENLKLGMFVHFGLYSIVGKGEWYMHNENVPAKEYEKLTAKFKVKRNWAKQIVATAKSFNAKYIVLTTRHHDGFSLYNTQGLSGYDIMHTPTNRDLVKEFVDECNKNNILPFFYHTIIDWHNSDFKNNSERYFDYLKKCIELLCTNYGAIGGFWFDGTWSDDNYNWHLDEIFSIIKKNQPNAIIANNGGWEHPGQVIHKDIDCIVYERASISTPTDKIDNKHRAKEVCFTLNNHWGFVKTDKNYKSVTQLANLYLECRQHNTNLLLNVGPTKNGDIKLKEKVLLKKFYKNISTLQ